MGGFSVDPRALSETARGIASTINELKPLGIDESAEVGRGFSRLALTGEEAGHPDVRGPWEEFCQRWSWGVRTLVRDGNQIAARLGLSAGLYHDVEDYVGGTLKAAAVAAVGDPHAADQQVAGQSWTQLAGDQAPDYRAGSWGRAGHAIAGQWISEGRDLAGGPYGLAKGAAGALSDGQRFTQVENQVFGPAPGGH